MDGQENRLLACFGLVGFYARTLDAGRYLKAEAQSSDTHLCGGI